MTRWTSGILHTKKNMHFTSYDVSWNVFAFHKVLYLENMRKKSGGDFINNGKIDKVLKYVS
jgi:hypothetical protein